MFRVQFDNGYKATYRDGTWTSTDERLTVVLNTLEHEREDLAADTHLPTEDDKALDWIRKHFKQVTVIQESDQVSDDIIPGVEY